MALGGFEGLLQTLDLEIVTGTVLAGTHYTECIDSCGQLAITSMARHVCMLVAYADCADVQVEDSGVIECTAGKLSTRKASQVLAVCGQCCNWSHVVLHIV